MIEEFVNQVTSNLKPYPMEELARIKAELIANNQTFYDFGTGDPKIPTWKPIIKSLKDSVPETSQYPGIRGIKALTDAQKGYLKRRIGIDEDGTWDILPTRGSKEAIFHTALCLVGRKNKKRVIYPTPGYPVYKSSTEFAGGIPTPYPLTEENNYLLEPWTLDKSIIEETTAIWVNYPHNPTGKTVNKAYWEKLIEWCHTNDVILLSDDCYIDIYRDEAPICPLALSSDRVLTFMSLSKRSGITGFRSGFIAGDQRIIDPMVRARSNFGLGQPEFIQHASITAWNDDTHVEERRKIFNTRMEVVGEALKAIGLINELPEATFYMWCRIPKKFGSDDVKFCLSLAEKGIITSPSSWLGEGIHGYFRMALVPDIDQTKEAIAILTEALGTV